MGQLMDSVISISLSRISNLQKRGRRRGCRTLSIRHSMSISALPATIVVA
jgi:hypothetical protein